MAAKSLHVKKNDMVMVIAGKEKGKTGKVLQVLPEKGRCTGREPEYDQAPYAPDPWRVPRAGSSRRRRRLMPPMS